MSFIFSIYCSGGAGNIIAESKIDSVSFADFSLLGDFCFSLVRNRMVLRRFAHQLASTATRLAGFAAAAYVED
jgi:hypothetical protein